jgi:HAD superfamily hydrolase (TIGR01490 family)
MSRPVVAFFDADETLIAMKSPFSLLRYRLRQQGDADGSGYERLVGPLRTMAATASTPVEVVAKFYELFAGVPWQELLAQGQQWYGDLRRVGLPLIQAPLARLRAHQAAGHTVVVISGSWLATLGPLAVDLGIDEVFCTEPELDDGGRLTGRIARPMFGPTKTEAVRDALAMFGADPADCFAYADDPGDLPMLRMVGRPTVVGAHPRMTDLAAERGWPVLAATLPAGTCRQPV